MIEISTNFAIEAEDLINKGLFDEAIKICESGLLCYPNYSGAMLVLAKAYILKNDLDTAYQIIIKAQKMFPLNMAINKIKNEIENGTTIFNNMPEQTKIINEINITAEQPDIKMLLEKLPNEKNITEQDNIIENDVETEIDENLAGLEKIAGLMKQLSESDDASLNISDYNTKTYKKIENNDIIDNNFDDIKKNQNLTKIEFSQNRLTDELQKINIICKNSVEKLYEIDLDLPRIAINTQLDWYSPVHIPLENNFNTLHLFTEQLSLIDLNTIFDKTINPIDTSRTAIDSRTKDILILAEELKNAVIPRVEEESDIEEDFDLPIVASETMAKILVKQQKISQAIKIYHMLIADKPEKKEYYQEQIDLLSNN